MELLTQRLASLLTVKSLVTVILTAVFAAMAGTGRVTTEQFLTVFTVVIAFYFGTQSQKVQDVVAEGGGKGDTYNSYYTLPGEEKEAEE